MKQSKKVILAAALLSGGVLVGSLVNLNALGTAGADAGNAQDPLVTKSYVDQLVKQEIAKLNGGSSSSSNNNSGATGGTTSESTASEKMEIVTIKPGQQLIAKGGTEFVIRAGKAVIFSADGSGVSDLTDGADLMNGANAPSNHLLQFPRDGRGITAVDATKNSVIVMVRGDYSIKNVEADAGISTE